MTTNKVADQNNDTSDRELFTYLSIDGLSLPSYVKEAEIQEVKTNGLQKHAHADDINCLFPLDTPARVYVSNAFFQQKKAEILSAKGLPYIQKVANRLEKAAATFGITADVKQYNEAFLTESTKAPKSYNVSLKVANTQDYNLFNFSSADDVTVKSAEFIMDLEKYPFSWRRQISNEFIKAARYFEVDELPDLIFKYAGTFFPDPNGAMKEVERRANKVKEASRHIYDQVVEALETANSNEDYFKVAEILYNVESQEGLYKNAHYRKILGDAVDKLFVYSLDKVAKMLDVVNVHGKLYSLEDFSKVASDTFEQAFGFEKPASSDDLRDVLPTLPLSDFSLFKKLSGIKELT